MQPDADHRLDEAVILCGGLATRLRDVLVDRPKALVEVRGRPLLEWLLIRLARRDQVRHVVLATGHLADQIEHHFGHRTWSGLKLSYSRESQPLGTAGALRLAARLTQAPHLLVLNGDTYCQYDSRRLLDVHVRNGAMATLWLSRPDDPSRFGSVLLDGDGRIVRFEEKSGNNNPQLASAGVYIIERGLVLQIQPDRAVSLEFEVFPSLVTEGLYGVEGDSPFIDVGTPESLSTADDAIASQLNGLDCG